jgi:hypothetical protein
MDPWMVLGTFLLGAGAGSLASTLLHAEQIRDLKELLEAAPHNNRQTDEQVSNSDSRRSA